MQRDRQQTKWICRFNDGGSKTFTNPAFVMSSYPENVFAIFVEIVHTQFGS